LITSKYQSILHAFKRGWKNSSRHGHSFPWESGGSEKSVLMKEMKEELWWYYLDTRRFGSAVHSGFGFERLVLFVTGMTNIRDVIPFQEHH
jgi:hypothetical protein